MFALCLVGAVLGSEVSEPARAFHAPGGATSLAKASRGAESKMDLKFTKEEAPEAKTELKKLAMALNPVVGFYDPLRLSDYSFWQQTNEASIGFLRHAEIKHGRVAMAAFVGYCLQSNGYIWPWQCTPDLSFAQIAAAGSPPEQWDALPQAAKLQILHFVGFLEFWSESSWILEQEGQKHYMRGGIPGKMPTFDTLPHPAPNLYDPFRFNAKKTREQLDRGLLAELNNGRLAQLGIMAFLSEQKIPGAVPALKGLVKPYAGEVMSFFGAPGTELA